MTDHPDNVPAGSGGSAGTTPAGLTPSQTVGPFVHLALADPDAWAVVAEDTEGAIELTGHVLDGAGAPVSDAVVETWQAGPAGDAAEAVSATEIDRSPFAPSYFGRCATDADGRWRIRTRKPGAVVTFDRRRQAPHVLVSVFARGLLDRVVTRLYFDDEPEANAADPVLALVDDGRRARLLARHGGSHTYELDIVLQGDDETPFFVI